MAMKFESFFSDLENSKNLAPEDAAKKIVSSMFTNFNSIFSSYFSNQNQEEDKMSKRVITFGTWGNQPIKWLVLKEEKFKTLLISKVGLFTYQYNSSSSKESLWKDSDIRKYLNNEFWKQAFTQEEKKKIVNTFLQEDVNTKDNIFLLSSEESEKYLTTNERSCTGTFWTRSKHSSKFSYYIDNNGYTGYTWVYNTYVIRPAIYIKNPIK